MESQPQNPEFRINSEKFRPCTCCVSNSMHNPILTKWLDLLPVFEVVV